MSDLAQVLERAGRRGPPPMDGLVDVVARPDGARAAIVAFSGHLVIAADVEAAAINQHFQSRDYQAWCDPVNALWLAAAAGGRPNIVDVVLVAPGVSGKDDVVHPAASSVMSHPRVVEASAPRHGVEVFAAEGAAGVLVMGTGLAGRRQLAFEVEPTHRNRGIGRAHAVAARRRTPEGSLLWAQVAPANAASIRALLAAGFTLPGTEQLIH